MLVVVAILQLEGFILWTAGSKAGLLRAKMEIPHPFLSTCSDLLNKPDSAEVLLELLQLPVFTFAATYVPKQIILWVEKGW